MTVISTSDHRRSLCVMACVLILTVAAAVRILGAINDLWHDELMSVETVRKLSSPLQIVTAIHFDNNHYLNSLWIFVLGQRGNWPGYRILSVVAGMGTVVLAGLIGRRRNVTSALLAMLLASWSYVMVMYSTEARGYASVVFFSLLCYYLLERYLERPSWPVAVAFSLSAGLGFLSQLVFVSFLLSAVVWSGYRLVKSRCGPRRIAVAMLSCYTLPIALLAILYWVDIRHMVIHAIGGHYHVLPWYEEALAWALGPPSEHSMLGLTSLAALAILAAGIGILHREKSDSFVFYIAVVLATPILLAALHISAQQKGIWPRYLIVGMAFFLLLFSFVLASLFHRGAVGKAICFGVLIVFGALNGHSTMKLIKYGRGECSEIVRLFAAHANGPLLTVVEEKDPGVPSDFVFFGRELLGNRELVLCPGNFWHEVGPEWIASWHPLIPMAGRFADDAGNEYELVMMQDHGPLTGRRWHVYRKVVSSLKDHADGN